MKIFSFFTFLFVSVNILSGQVYLGFVKTSGYTVVRYLPNDTVFESNYIDKKPKIRIGVSLQNALFFEFGLAFNRTKSDIIESRHYNKRDIRSRSIYISCEFQTRDSSRIYGPKIGFEILKMNSIVSIISGFETTYYFNNKNNCIVLTPKVGISFLFFDLYYGYNFKFNNRIPEINKNKIGVLITFNNAHYYKQRKFEK
jgi:hypothetical protein